MSQGYIKLLLKVAPFPPPPISPLVSQAGSPVSSRSTSPHRTMNIRAPPVLPALEPLVLPAQLPPMETLSHSSLPLFNSDIKLPDEEVCQLNYIMLKVTFLEFYKYLC